MAKTTRQTHKHGSSRRAPWRLASHLRVRPSDIWSSALRSSGSAQPDFFSHDDTSKPVTGPRSAKVSFATPLWPCAKCVSDTSPGRRWRSTGSARGKRTVPRGTRSRSGSSQTLRQTVAIKTDAETILARFSLFASKKFVQSTLVFDPVNEQEINT